jgi:hypothetical protein
MIKRIAIAIGGAAAAGVLALSLAAAGFGPAQTDAGPSDAVVPSDVAAAAPGLIADPAVQVQTETVYIRPAAAPKVIHVTKQVPAKAASQKAGKVSARRSRDHDDEDHEERDRDHEEHEGEDD